MKVRIYKPHTHAGMRYEPGPDGMDIEVDEASAKFITTVGADKAPDKVDKPDKHQKDKPVG